MHNLQLDIAPEDMSGAGLDMVGRFTLHGRCRPDGHVEFLKQYEGAHAVLYVGTYDGEGTFFGTWDISGYRGDWSIKILGPTTDKSDEIQEILPL